MYHIKVEKTIYMSQSVLSGIQCSKRAMLVGCDGNKPGAFVSLCSFPYDNSRGGSLKILPLGLNGLEVIPQVTNEFF